MDLLCKSIVDLHSKSIEILQNRSEIKSIGFEKYFPDDIFFDDFVSSPPQNIGQNRLIYLYFTCMTSFDN